MGGTSLPWLGWCRAYGTLSLADSGLVAGGVALAEYREAFLSPRDLLLVDRSPEVSGERVRGLPPGEVVQQGLEVFRGLRVRAVVVRYRGGGGVGLHHGGPDVRVSG
jgi:hypothetical protein